MKNISSNDLFYAGTALAAQYADVSDIADGEIRPLYPVNPPPIKEIDKWDGKLQNKAPIHGDLGINNKREMFWFTHTGEWRAIS